MKTRRGADLALLVQAALILFPLAGISLAALYLLKQDQAAIRMEAESASRPVAVEAARRAAQKAGPLIERLLQQHPEFEGVIVRGQIKSPPPFPQIPSPPAWISKITPVQAVFIRAAEQADYLRQDARAATAAWTKVRDTAGRNNGLRLSAEYCLLLLNPQADSARCVAFAAAAGDEHSDAGAPLSQLAVLLALQRLGKSAFPSGLFAQIEASVRRTPSFLTRSVLDAAEAAAVSPEDLRRVRELNSAWRESDATLEAARIFTRPGRGEAEPSVQWIGQGADASLVMRLPEKDRARIARLPLRVLKESLHAEMAALPTPPPEYASLELALAGRSLQMMREPLPESQRLASSDEAAPGLPLRVSAALYLTREERLFARYRQRRLLTAGLIGLAAFTASIGMAGLWRASRRQARLSAMKSNFVSSVSHELRAPIASIRLMAENLENRRVDGEARQHEYFRLIVQECRRLTSLVENVLDFSRIDQARRRYVFELVGVGSLVTHAVAMMQPYAEERGVALEYHGSPEALEGVRARWDGQAVQQALVNLLDNAIKHSPNQASVGIGIERGGDGKGEPYLAIWVEDAGPGIPAEDHARIFDLFYRRGSELRRETGGVGIGLTIVKHVAEAHGGRVALRSAVGEGSRFSLILPVTPRETAKS